MLEPPGVQAGSLYGREGYPLVDSVRLDNQEAFVNTNIVEGFDTGRLGAFVAVPGS